MHLSPRHPRTSRALARLQDESGIALVMALGIMLVLAIALTTTIFFTSASLRHANSSNAGQKAYTIAEAGLNNAISQLAPYYAAATATDGGTGGSISGNSPSFPGGTVSWTGTFDAGTNIWSLTGTGTVKNPTGGADITRTARAKLPVSLQPPPFTKYGLFVDDDTGECTRLRGGTTITQPVYAKGCLDLSSNTGIEEPNPSGSTTVSVNVGRLNVGGGGHVGTTARPINWLGTGLGGCNGGACPGGADVHAETYASNVSISLPTIDKAFMDALYLKANWLAPSCDPVSAKPFDTVSGRSNSLGTTNLTGSSYLCTARDGLGNEVGRLGWNSSTTVWNGIPPKTLLVTGAVFVDGTLGNEPKFQYTGNGTIYFNGGMDLKKAKICGPQSGFDGSTCGHTWEPANGALLMVACHAKGSPANADCGSATGFAVDTGTGTELEAGVWAIGDIDATSHPYFGGSVFMDKGYADFTGGGGMKAFINLPAGAPTGGQWTLGKPYEYK